MTDGGQPANGLYDLTFQLFDDSTGGWALGTNTFPGAVLSNGTYTAALDFGADAFNGDARWLELALRTNGAADFTTLTPRQAVTPTPTPSARPTPAASAAPSRTPSFPPTSPGSTPPTSSAAR